MDFPMKIAVSMEAKPFANAVQNHVQKIFFDLIMIRHLF